MKVFAISDLHMSNSCDKPMYIFGASWQNYLEEITADWRARVEEGDVVLLSGDLSWALRMEQALPDLQLLAGLPGKKVLLRGNHDYWWSTISKVRNVLPEGIFAVQNDVLRIGRLLICGTRGWTVPDGKETEEDRRLFARECERLKLTLAAMQRERTPEDIVGVMTHFPPFNVNRTPNPFWQAIEEAKPNFAVYGHLHGKDCRSDLVVTRAEIPYYLTSCDQVGNKLVQIWEIEP